MLRTFFVFIASTSFIMAEDKNRNIWFCAGKGLQPGAMTLNRLSDIDLSPLAQNTRIEQITKTDGLIFGIYEDKEGGIWFGTLDGVCLYNGTSFDYFACQSGQTDLQLTLNRATCIS